MTYFQKRSRCPEKPAKPTTTKRPHAPKPVLHEEGVSLAVQDYLALRERMGDLTWSITDPASKERSERGRRVRKGWSDITACVRGGTFLGIELKRPGRSHTTPEQLAFRAKVTALGGVAVECRSVAEVAAAVEKAIRR